MTTETLDILCKVDARRRAQDNITHDEAIDYAARVIGSEGLSDREKAVMIFASFINYLHRLETGV